MQCIVVLPLCAPVAMRFCACPSSLRCDVFARIKNRQNVRLKLHFCVTTNLRRIKISPFAVSVPFEKRKQFLTRQIPKKLHNKITIQTKPLDVRIFVQFHAQSGNEFRCLFGLHLDRANDMFTIENQRVLRNIRRTEKLVYRLLFDWLNTIWEIWQTVSVQLHMSLGGMCRSSRPAPDAYDCNLPLNITFSNEEEQKCE